MRIHALLVTAAVAAVGSAASAQSREIGIAVYVGDEMVRDYRPEPMLVTGTTRVDRPRFPVIDIHCHWTLREDPREMLAAMDARGVRQAVNLSGGWGERLEAMLDIFHAVSSDRFVIFANVDFSRIDEPGFGRAMADELRAAREKGAAGLKIFKDLGLRIRDGSGALVAVDDPRLDPIWAACGELGMPVLIHTGDPAAFFRPVDGRNERWMQLKRHPTWSFYAEPGTDRADLPSRDEVLAQRSRVMKRHPGTTFIGAHMGGYAEDLAAAGRLLDEHPNLYLDLSGRVAELGRQPYTARRFFVEHADRIVFGSDRFPGRPDQPRYRIYYRFLESDDEYFDYYDHPFPPAGEWKIYGIFLPDDVLRKVYHANADRILDPDG